MYSDRLFLRAVVIMIVRHFHTGHELLSVLTQPTGEMRTLRLLLTQQDRSPTRLDFPALSTTWNFASDSKLIGSAA